MIDNILIEKYLSPVNDDTVVQEIKSSNLPLVLWGAGEVAEKVYSILLKNNCSISSVWVDGGEKKSFHNFIPKSIEEIFSLYPTFNVVIGHNRYDKIDELKNRFSQINNVYYFYNSFNWEEGFDENYYLTHENTFRDAFLLCEDDISREAYIQYINSRIGMNPCYVKSKCVVDGYFKNDVFDLGDNEILLEVGAFNGNVLKIFNDETIGRYKKIIALEPDITNYNTLLNNIKSLHDVEAYNIGCWNEKTELRFCIDGTGKSNHIDDSGKSEDVVSVDTIDCILADSDVSYINIFFQTGIMEILEGAKNTIALKKPKLIIGIGLRKEHSFMVPIYIKKLNPQYKIFYRFYGGVPSRFYVLAF